MAATRLRTSITTKAVLASGRANAISTGANNALVAVGVDPGGGQPGDTQNAGQRGDAPA